MEHDHSSAADDEGFDGKVKPLNDQMTMVDDGGAVAPGITAMATFGRTPGHFAYRVESGDQQLVLITDMANHYV